MFERYSITSSKKKLENRFEVSIQESNLHPVFNASPLMDLPLITNSNSQNIQFFKWGLIPEWAPDPSNKKVIINAPYENLLKKPAFRSTLKAKRCLIIADGFYLWKNTQIGKIPYRITLKNEEPFAFAGLWDEWKDEENDNTLQTFVIITQPSIDQISAINERMPLILNREDEKDWLNTNEKNALSILERAETEELTYYSISKRINDRNEESKELIKKQNYEIPIQVKLF